MTGIDPAEAMVDSSPRRRPRSSRGWSGSSSGGWEEIDEVDAYDVAVALGVFDYVERPAELLRRMVRAATHVVGSFPRRVCGSNCERSATAGAGSESTGTRASDFTASRPRPGGGGGGRPSGKPVAGPLHPHSARRPPPSRAEADDSGPLLLHRSSVEFEVDVA